MIGRLKRTIHRQNQKEVTME